MKKTILFFLLLAKIYSSYAETCKRGSKIEEFQSSDLIVLCEVIDIRNEEFKVKIFEIFKGNPKNKVITIFASEITALKISTGQHWLFYLKKEKSSKWTVNNCGWSRSFNNPLRVNPPPPPTMDMSSSQMELMIANYRTIATLELTNDLQFLRNEKNQSSSFVCDTNDLKLNIIIILLFILLLFMIGLIFKPAKIL